MEFSRRDLSFLLPAIFAAGASAQDHVLPSKTYLYEDLKVKTNGQNSSRAILDGTTHRGYEVEIHETELGPGQMPHAAHHHVHEEAILMIEGSVEVTISGHSTKLGPGSLAYVASNEEHGWRNVGDTTAKYFVLALGGDKA